MEREYDIDQTVVYAEGARYLTQIGDELHIKFDTREWLFIPAYGPTLRGPWDGWPKATTYQPEEGNAYLHDRRGVLRIHMQAQRVEHGMGSGIVRPWASITVMSD